MKTSTIRYLALALLVLVPITTLRADVAPFASWRVEVGGGRVYQSVQVGSILYVGGNFSKIGTATAPFSAMFDPAALTFTPVSGCARPGAGESRPGAGVIPIDDSATLSDANGPFPLPAGTRLVRVGTDCRFDRRFRVALPAGILLWPGYGADIGLGIVETGGRVYFQAAPGTSSAAAFLVEADGVTGAILRFWSIDPAAPYLIRGALPGGRLLATSEGPSVSSGLGWVDPALGGAFQLKRVLPAYSTTATVQTGSVVVLSAGGFAGNPEIVALDAGSLEPLANWPSVRGWIFPVAAAGSGRLFLAGSGFTIDGAPAPKLLSFDAATGARLTNFVPPAWVNDVGGFFDSLVVAANRLVVFGNFAPGAPRDTAVALDAATGALDPWTLPYETSFGGWPVGGLRYFPRVTTRDRVARANLAAVDAQTGHVLPWTVADSPVVTALAADAAAGHLYVASTGRVRRFDLASGLLDPHWTFDVFDALSAPGGITGLAVGLGRVYAVGTFSLARDGASAPWQPREAAAAVTLAGALSPWRPALWTWCGGGRTGPWWPCVSALRISQGRVFLQGTLGSAADPTPARSLMAVTADTGAVDPVLPFVAERVVNVLDSGPSALFLDARVGPTRYLASFSTIAGPRLLAPVNLNPGSSLAAFGDRLYFDVERDDTTGAPTGNPVAWRQPAAAVDGVTDREDGFGIAWYAALAPRAPQSPVDLAVTLNGPNVTFEWLPGAGDFAPFGGVIANGSAATSHVLLASVTAGGAPAVQIDTRSADTRFTIAAPTGAFYVRVQARNAFGTSAPSAEVRVDVQAQAPGPPIATVGTVQGRTVRIEWQAPSLGWAATSYRLEAGTAPGLSNLGTLPVSGTTFEASVPAGRYYVRIRAVNASGASAPGDELTIDVP